MRTRLAGIIAAVLICAAGTGILLLYVQANQDRAAAGEQAVPALVVSTPVAAGTAVTELDGLVTPVQIPAATAPDGRLTDLADHAEEVATVDLVPGEVLIAGRFATPDELRAAGRVEVPDDHRQVTFSLDPQRALGGQIRPGDTVGVFVSVDETGEGAATHLVVRDVLVTNVQRDDTPAQPADGAEPTGVPPPANNLLVTLALHGDDAPRAVYGAEFGRLWLSAEGPETSTTPTNVQTTESIHR